MSNIRRTIRPIAAPTLRPEPWKLITFITLLVLSLVLLIVRLTIVQLIEGPMYAEKARANQIRSIPIAAPRGRVYDRNGIILVRSRPSFVCALIPSEIQDIRKTLRTLSSIISVPEAVMRQRLLHHHGVNYDDFEQVVLYEPYGPIILASDLSAAQTARLAEVQSRLPGVDLEAQPVRNYPYGLFGSHIFGYVGQISEEEYQRRKSKG
jgi:penicillin-binding protein 2